MLRGELVVFRQPFVPAMLLFCTACGGLDLAMQRSSSAQQMNSGVTCVRPDKPYAKDQELSVSVGPSTYGGRVKDSFELKESARAACLREAANVQFQVCVSYANGIITKEQYRERVLAEEARCDR